MRSFQRKKPKMTASFMLTAVEEGVCVTERGVGETVVCVCVCVCGGGGVFFFFFFFLVYVIGLNDPRPRLYKKES